MTDQDLRALASAYALGALDTDEARAFEAALADSPELQREVASYREVAGYLGAGNRLEPPPGLRERVLARVREEGPHRRGAPAMPIASPARWRPALWVALAASLALSAWLGLEIGNLRGVLAARDSLLAARESQLAAREQTLNAILEPGVQLILLTRTGEAPPGIQLYWDRQRHSAILHAFRLPPVQTGRTYQLWLIRDGRPVPSVTFNTDPDGHMLREGVTIPREPGIQAYAVTEEPAGGSAQPTGPILLSGEVPGS